MNQTPFQIHRSGYEQWRRCRRRFYFDYLATLPGAHESTPKGLASTRSSPDLAIGSAFHAAMESSLQKNSYSTGIERAVTEIRKSAEKEWSGCMLGYQDEATAYYEQMAHAMAWVAHYLVAPIILDRFTVHYTEKELPPIQFEKYPGLEMASRPDAILEDVTGDIVLASWKTCSSVSSELERAVFYDTQGLSESACFYMVTGKWPSVQMVYVVKGRRIAKDVPFVRYEGPLTRAYRKEYAKGGVAISPKYTNGWEKVNVFDLPSGPEAYWKEHFLSNPFPEYLPYFMPPAANRSKKRAMDWLKNNIFPDMHSAINRPHSLEHFPADESLDACFAFGVECGWRDACHELIQISEIPNIGPRIPHHERDTNDD